MKTTPDRTQATAESQHSPTPWRVGGTFPRSIYSADDGEVCDCNSDSCTYEAPSKVAYANAQLIVRAVNSRAALVAALEASNRMLSMLAPLLQDGPHVNKIPYVEEQMRANRAALS